jgi:MFS transporter, DHA1 family, tetracycline resistance protein
VLAFLIATVLMNSIGFTIIMPFALFITELGVLSIEKLGWGPSEVGLVSLLVGGTDIVMQGVLAGRLLPIFGPIKMTIAGLIAEIASYLLVGAVALVPSPLLMAAQARCIHHNTCHAGDGP